MEAHRQGREERASVTLDGISRSFGDLHAVANVSVQIPAGSFFSLLGPSGCGKSTTLRMIGGFEAPDSGSIRIGTQDVTTWSPQRRPTAMVFQNYALFPHMTVAENVGYGLAARRVEKTERRRKVIEALTRVELERSVDKPVTELSGGQQQRVALARALATEPDVLLFDEPLSNLDVELREQTRVELKRMQHELGVTSIYVTHDQEEALALSDQIAIMKDGRIVQTGTPRELYAEPATAFAARFLGGSNLLTGEIAARIAGEAPGPGTVLSIRPEDIIPDVAGNYVATVIEQQFLGRSSELWLDLEGTTLKARMAPQNVDEKEIRFSVRAFRTVRDDR